jgi:ATP-grasp domain, R2K clade family 2
VVISKAFIQEQGNGKLRVEEQLVVEELNRRGVPMTFYTHKRMQRRQLPLDRQSLVVGDMPCIFGALQQLAIPAPLPNDYPDSLSEFLHRRVWRSTLGKLEFGLREDNCRSIFAKPATRCKRFTGCVFDGESDLDRVYGVSRHEELLCAEVVTWLSEYRVYVVDSEIRSVDWYAGDRGISIDLLEVQRAIEILTKAGESYAGYAIDFGVLASGATALVEMNDGFAIGAYSIDSKNYTDLIWARWAELLTAAAEPT